MGRSRKNRSSSKKKQTQIVTRQTRAASMRVNMASAETSGEPSRVGEISEIGTGNPGSSEIVRDERAGNQGRRSISGNGNGQSSNSNGTVTPSVGSGQRTLSIEERMQQVRALGIAPNPLHRVVEIQEEEAARIQPLQSEDQSRSIAGGEQPWNQLFSRNLKAAKILL